MGYWVLNPRQEKVLKRFVSKKTFLEIGCGDCTLAILCLNNYNAERAILVDYKKPYSMDKIKKLPIEFKHTLFQDIRKPIKADVCILSWPDNKNSINFVKLCSECEVIIYIGSVFNGSDCGNADLFSWFKTRELVCRVTGERNNLIVYKNVVVQRRPCRDEIAGCDREKIYQQKTKPDPRESVYCNKVPMPIE